MSKGIDEIKEKIKQILEPDEACWGCVCDDCDREQQEILSQILKAETPTHRIAIVRKKPELPLILVDAKDAQIVRDIKQAMLDAGFVQEERLAS